MERYTKETKKKRRERKATIHKMTNEKSKPNRDDWKQKGVKRKWCKEICDESK